MTDQLHKLPPPLPNFREPEGPVFTYVRFSMIFVPALAALSFCSVFLLPKAEVIWLEAGLDHSRVSWFMETTRAIMLHGKAIFLVFSLAIVALEVFWKSWPRWRSWLLVVILCAFNTFVLSTLTMTSIAVSLAVPLIIERGKK